MAIGESAGLLFKITGDASDAIKAIRDTRQESDALTGAAGTLGDSLGALANPATLAATALAAGAAAALAFTSKLFDLSKQAAEFGSEIYDASQKTGLGAEALSALKFASEQAGSSFEQVTKGITVFGVALGEAEQGSDKARDKMAALGVTSTDLDEALGQVFKTIADAKSPTEQLALATAAFGKKIGPDLIPLIKDANGNFEELKQKARELGVTIGDDAAAKADAFGDQMDLLNTQLAGIARTIGFSVMPIFLEWATKLSEFLARNSGEIARWGNAFGRTMRFIVDSIVNNIDAFAGLAEIIIAITTQDWSRAASGIERIGKAIEAQRGAWGDLTGASKDSGVRDAGGRIRSVLPGDVDEPGKSKSGGRRVRDTADDARRRDAQAEINTELINLKTIEDQFRSTITDAIETQAAAPKAFAALWQKAMGQFNEQLRVSLGYIEERERALLAADASEAERGELAARQIQRRRALEKEYADFRTDSIKKIESQEEKLRDREERNDADRKKREEREAAEHERRKKRWNERIQQLKLEADAETAAMLKSTRAEAEGQMVTGPGTLGAGIADGLGIELVPMFDDATNAMISFSDRMKLVHQDINSFVGQGIGAMVDGLGQMAAAWLSTGEFSAKAALQMLSSVAFSIATQAGLKAIFEYAEGLAALGVTWGVPNPSSVAHFAAAATYGTIAAIAGGAGVALGLGARAMGGGGGGGARGALSSAAGGGDSGRNNTPISRTSDDAFTSGREGTPFQRMNDHLNQLVNTLNRFDAMSPGDVLAKGIQQERGLIGKTLVQETAADSSIGTGFRRASGLA